MNPSLQELVLSFSDSGFEARLRKLRSRCSRRRGWPARTASRIEPSSASCVTSPSGAIRRSPSTRRNSTALSWSPRSFASGPTSSRRRTTLSTAVSWPRSARRLPTSGPTRRRSSSGDDRSSHRARASSTSPSGGPASACQVPRAPLPSTVIMTVVPAQVAGVKEIAVVSPPRYQAGAEHRHESSIRNPQSAIRNRNDSSGHSRGLSRVGRHRGLSHRRRAGRGGTGLRDPDHRQGGQDRRAGQ